MKPFILVCGVPHSFTSMVSNFIIDNGAYSKEIWNNPKYNLPYSRFEERVFQEYVDNRRKFKEYDLTDYFDSLPADEVTVAKVPLSVFFINDLSKYTDRTIKIVYVIRNPEQVILSSLEKSRKSFIFHFEMIAWVHRFIADCKFEVFPLIAERIKMDGQQLLNFCELSNKEIKYDSIKPFQTRKPEYYKYRFANFVWKRLSRFFQIY